MSIQTFSLGTIEQIMEGTIVAEFDRLIDEARSDCRNRARIDKPRRVTLEVTLTPTDPDQPHLMSVQFSSKSMHPKADLCGYVMSSKKDGLSFSTASPSNPDQLTFEDDDSAVDVTLECGGKRVTTTLNALRSVGE